VQGPADRLTKSAAKPPLLPISKEAQKHNGIVDAAQTGDGLKLTQNPRTDKEESRGKLGRKSERGDEDDAQERSHGPTLPDQPSFSIA
jgi:hypothetical protein